MYGKPTDEPTLPNQRDFRHALANRYENQECENYVSTTCTLLKVRKEHGLPALINPYLVEKAQEYNQTQEEAFQAEEETEGEENSDEEVTASQDNQGDSSREVIQVDGSSEIQKQKKRKVDFDPDVLETSNLGGSTRRVPLKERRLQDSESEEGGRAKKPLTLDIAKAQKYPTSIRTPSEDTSEHHIFRFQSNTHSDHITGTEKNWVNILRLLLD